MSINECEGSGLKHFNVSTAFSEHSIDVSDIFENTEEDSMNKKRKIMIVFDEMIADMLSNKKFNPTVTELLIRGTNLNITFLFYYTILFCCTRVI